MLEYDKNFNPLRDELLIENLRIEDGFVEVPDGPGLGVEIDMAVVQKYQVKPRKDLTGALNKI
jgi:D-galactarolactone cycloisomerase